MSPELTAILLTSLLQLVGLLILGISLGRMVRENGKMLERIEGIGAPNSLQGRQMKEVLEEIRRFIVTEVRGRRSRDRHRRKSIAPPTN
jgi:hypothetical protein